MVNRTVQYRKEKRPSGRSPERAKGRPKDAAKGGDIVDAASHLFLKDGYERTSMEAVAKRANVSKLTIYSHFADKNELFRHVIRCRCDRLLNPDGFAACGDLSAEKGLMKLGDLFVRHIFNPDSVRLHRTMQAEALHHPQAVQAFYEAGPLRVRAAFGGVLREWCRRRELAIADIPKATEQFFSLLKGEMMMRAILRRGPPPDAAALRRHVRATVVLFLAAYRYPDSRPAKADTP